MKKEREREKGRERERVVDEEIVLSFKERHENLIRAK